MRWVKLNLYFILRPTQPTYFPSVASAHSLSVLPLSFHGNLHSAFLSGLSLVVKQLGIGVVVVFTVAIVEVVVLFEVVVVLVVVVSCSAVLNISKRPSFGAFPLQQ